MPSVISPRGSARSETSEVRGSPLVYLLSQLLHLVLIATTITTTATTTATTTITTSNATCILQLLLLVVTLQCLFHHLSPLTPLPTIYPLIFTSQECPTDSGEGQTSASSNSGETEADGAFPMFPEGLEGHVALDGGLDGGLEEEEEGVEEEEDAEMQGAVQEIAKPQLQEKSAEEPKVEEQGNVEVVEEGQGKGHEEGHEVVVKEVVQEVVKEVVQELVQEDQQKQVFVDEAKVLQGLDVALEGAMEIVNEVFAAPGPLFTESSDKNFLPLENQNGEMKVLHQEVVVVEVEAKEAVVVPVEAIPQVVQPPLLTNRQEIVEPEQQQQQQLQQQQHQQQQQPQPIVGRKRGYSSDWKDNGVLDIAPSSKNPRELQRMEHPYY